MINDEELSMVGINCPGYSPPLSGVNSSLGMREMRSCRECNHFSNEECSINIFKTILFNMNQN